MSGCDLLKYLSLLLTFISADNVLGQNSNAMEFLSVRHESNPNVVKEILFTLVKHNGHQALNGSVTFSQDLDDFDLTYLLLMPKAKGKPFTLINATTNGCRFLQAGASKNLNLLFMIWQKIRRVNPSLPEKCPVKKNKPIAVQNFYIDSKFDVPSMPEVKIDVIFGVSSKSMDVFTCFVALEVTPRRKKMIRG